MKRLAVLAPALLLAVAAGCAPARHRIAGEEAAAAAALFARGAGVAYPYRASFAGFAEYSGTTVPLVVGVHARGASDESAGVYDPLGRPFLYVENDGRALRFTRGEAAPEVLAARLRTLAAGPVSLARLLSGGPAYPLDGMTAARGADGQWILSGARQALFSDPARRALARAEYEVGGKRFVVTYPDRPGDGAPPPTVSIEGLGARIVLRRDEE